MKSYKAIVIDGKKIIRRGFQLAVLFLIASIAVINFKIANVPISLSPYFSQATVEESIPAMKGYSEDTGIMKKLGRYAMKALNFVLTFDVDDPRTVLFGEIPLIHSVSNGHLAKMANEDAWMAYNPHQADMGQGEPEPEAPQGGVYPIKEVDSGQAKALGDPKKILIRNETEFGINIEQMLSDPLKFDMKGDGPKVLIVHTHATESYSPDGADTYNSEESDRSLDAEKNMLKVGETVKGILEEKGIGVIHDRTLHDHPNFNGSYENSRKTVEKYLSEYPSICIVLDLHRDAFVYEDGSKAKFVTEVNGEKAAQLMFVVGTDAGGLEHPNWRENMKLALKLQSYISQKHPTLMRGVNLRKERFNGHTTYGSLIIEVGSSGNSLSEAINGATYGAVAIADFLNSLK